MSEFLAKEEGYPIKCEDLKFENAFLEKDILWENLGSNQLVAGIKQWVFCIFLFIFFLFIMVPTNLLNALEKGDNHCWKEFVNFLKPNLVLIINALVPICIDISLSKESYLTKSSRDISKMRRTYFFVVLNTLLLPITATSVEAFTSQLSSKDGLLNLPDMISNGLMS